MSSPHDVTAEELFAHREHERHELVRGTLRVCEPPGGEHGRLATRLAHLLHVHVERQGLGVVLVETGYILRRAPDTVRGPDISFVAKARMPANQVPEAFIAGAPDLAVEVLSPDDRAPEIDERLADYFAAGARLVWIVEPREKRIVIRQPSGARRAVTLPDSLDGEDVVPGFSCSVAEVFGL